jgi:hypothetical protein
MLNKSTLLTYPFLVILSIGKKSFANMGRFIQTSGRVVAKFLQPAHINFDIAHQLSQLVFSDKKKLFLIIDDTMIKKIFASNIRGTGMFFDTKIGRCINAFKLMTAMLSDGKYCIPIDCSYLFAKEIVDLCSESFLSKDEIAKAFIRLAIKLFPDVKIILLADGLYASVELLKWCIENKIPAEMRMHSNRVVTHKGTKKKLRELANEKGIKLTGKQTARTISVDWHGLALEITIVKRIDKKERESIVFQVATYKAEPREHVKAYNVRWGTEMGYRTKKQTLGLGECFSQDLTVQHNHVSSVLLAYGFAQLEMKRQRLKTPEAAIRAIKEKVNQSRFQHFIDQYDFSPHCDA